MESKYSTLVLEPAEGMFVATALQWMISRNEPLGSEAEPILEEMIKKFNQKMSVRLSTDLLDYLYQFTNHSLDDPSLPMNKRVLSNLKNKIEKRM